MILKDFSKYNTHPKGCILFFKVLLRNLLKAVILYREFYRRRFTVFLNCSTAKQIYGNHDHGES